VTQAKERPADSTGLQNEGVDGNPPEPVDAVAAEEVAEQAAEPAPAKVSTFAALRIRNYRLFFTGQVVSNTGTWMQRIAQDWLVLSLTNSPLAVGITTALQFGPMGLFGLFGGLTADRHNKRRILLATQTAMLILATTLTVLSLTGLVQVWHVYLIALGLGFATVFDNPARQTFVSEMVPPHLVRNAVSLNVANFQLARMVGPAVAGVLISLVGDGWAFGINAISYLAVIAGLLLMRTSELQRLPRVERAKGQLREALRYVRNTPNVMWPIVLVFFVGTFGYNFAIVLSAYAKDVFHSNAGVYGLLNTAMALGSVAGALYAARRTTGSLRMLVVLASAFSALLVVLGLLQWLPLFVVVLVIAGFASVSYNTMSNSTVQLASDPQLRGRVMSLYFLVFMGSTPIGSLIVGAITDHWGAPLALVVSGLICLVAAAGCGVLIGRQQGRDLHLPTIGHLRERVHI
jgi:MFS family permease